MPLLIPVITILMMLMIVPCIINCLTHFISAQVNRPQHAVPVQIYEMNHQSRFDAWYWMLGAGTLRLPRVMVWGGRKKGGSG